jgi:hypothetical protein
MLRRVAVAVGAVFAFALVASPAWAADPLEGRWEHVFPNGAPSGGPIYDFVATGSGAFTNRVVRSWPFNCGTSDGDITLTRIASPAAQPAYRGTHAVRHHLTPCTRLRDVAVELVLRPDGIALLSFKDGSGVIQYFKGGSLRVGRLSLNFRERIEQGVTELRPTVIRLGRRRDAVQREIAEHRATATSLLDSTSERSRIERLEGRLADYRSGLQRLARNEQRDPGDPGLAAIRREWEKRVQDFRVEIGRLRTVIGRRQLRLLEAEKALRDAVAERTRLDGRLTDIGRRLSPYDFEVSEVTVTADGEVVFRARASTARARDLQRIDGKLARLERQLAPLDAERVRAKVDFLAAQREVILAGERINDVVWENVAAGFATDVAFLALDLSVAAARGGFIGVAAEVTKKTAETVVFALVPASKAEEGSVEDDLRKLYGAKVKEVFSTDALERTAVERLLKETQFKVLVKDPATDYLKRRVFDPIKFLAEFNVAGRAIASEPSEENLRRVEKTVMSLLKTRDRLEDFATRQKGKPGTLRGLAESVTKDVVKLLVKKSLDARELEAWIEYFERDLYARAVTAHLTASSSKYWEVKEMVDELEGERRRQLDLPTAEKVVVDKRFAHGAILRISLKGQGRPGELAVVVGGERATPLGKFVYELRASADRADERGDVLLEVR